MPTLLSGCCQKHSAGYNRPSLLDVMYISQSLILAAGIIYSQTSLNVQKIH